MVLCSMVIDMVDSKCLADHMVHNRLVDTVHNASDADSALMVWARPTSMARVVTLVDNGMYAGNVAIRRRL